MQRSPLSTLSALIPLIPLLLFSLSTTALDDITFANFIHSATFSIAQQLGIFTHYNLNVTYAQIPNSTFAFEQLASGAYDVLGGQIDNALNSRLNGNGSVTVLGQLDAGPELVFAGIPSITCVSELRGKTIIVDSPVSGYAYLLQKILNFFGLRLDQGDYIFQAIGATDTRFTELLAGTEPNGSSVFATILTYPFVSEILDLPTTEQPTILFRVSSFVLPYASGALTISQSSLSSPTLRPKLVRLYAALLTANQFLATPSNAATSISAISSILNVSIEVGTSAYNAAIDPLLGETSAVGGNFTVDTLGLLNVIDARDQFGGFAALRAAEPGFSFVDFVVPGTGEFIDYSVQIEAVALAAQSTWTLGST